MRKFQIAPKQRNAFRKQQFKFSRVNFKQNPCKMSNKDSGGPSSLKQYSDHESDLKNSASKESPPDNFSDKQLASEEKNKFQETQKGEMLLRTDLDPQSSAIQEPNMVTPTSQDFQITPTNNNNLAGFGGGCGETSLNRSLKLDSQGYQESLSKILSSLRQQSGEIDILLGELFQKMLSFEKQVENLKISLFRRDDIAQLSNVDLFSRIFKCLDRKQNQAIDSFDLKDFVEEKLPSLLGYPQRIYDFLIATFEMEAGRALLDNTVVETGVVSQENPAATVDGVSPRLAYENQHISTTVNPSLRFADFLMMIWPQHRFRGLNKELLFVNQFPIYEPNTELGVSETTLGLIAEIVANYLQFFMERELILKKLTSHGFQAKDLFERILTCASNRNLLNHSQMSGDGQQDERFVNQHLLFSFFLQLPVIFSTFDTEIIISALLIDKRRLEVKFSDFQAMFNPLATNPAGNQQYQKNALAQFSQDQEDQPREGQEENQRIQIEDQRVYKSEKSVLSSNNGGQYVEEEMMLQSSQLRSSQKKYRSLRKKYLNSAERQANLAADSRFVTHTIEEDDSNLIVANEIDLRQSHSWLNQIETAGNTTSQTKDEKSVSNERKSASATRNRRLRRHSDHNNRQNSRFSNTIPNVVNLNSSDNKSETRNNDQQEIYRLRSSVGSKITREIRGGGGSAASQGSMCSNSRGNCSTGFKAPFKHTCKKHANTNRGGPACIKQRRRRSSRIRIQKTEGGYIVEEIRTNLDNQGTGQRKSAKNSLSNCTRAKIIQQRRGVSSLASHQSDNSRGTNSKRLSSLDSSRNEDAPVFSRNESKGKLQEKRGIFTLGKVSSLNDTTSTMQGNFKNQRTRWNNRKSVETKEAACSPIRRSASESGGTWVRVNQIKDLIAQNSYKSGQNQGKIKQFAPITRSTRMQSVQQMARQNYERQESQLYDQQQSPQRNDKSQIRQKKKFQRLTLEKDRLPVFESEQARFGIPQKKNMTSREQKPTRFLKLQKDQNKPLGNSFLLSTRTHMDQNGINQSYCADNLIKTQISGFQQSSVIKGGKLYNKSIMIPSKLLQAQQQQKVTKRGLKKTQADFEHGQSQQPKSFTRQIKKYIDQQYQLKCQVDKLVGLKGKKALRQMSQTSFNSSQAFQKRKSSMPRLGSSNDPQQNMMQVQNSAHFTGKELLRRTKSAARPTVQNMKIARLRYAPHLVNNHSTNKSNALNTYDSVSQRNGSNYSRNSRAASESNRHIARNASSSRQRKYSNQSRKDRSGNNSQKAMQEGIATSNDGKIRVHRMLSNESANNLNQSNSNYHQNSNNTNGRYQHISQLESALGSVNNYGSSVFQGEEYGGYGGSTPSAAVPLNLKEQLEQEFQAAKNGFVTENGESLSQRYNRLVQCSSRSFDPQAHFKMDREGDKVQDDAFETAEFVELDQNDVNRVQSRSSQMTPQIEQIHSSLENEHPQIPQRSLPVHSPRQQQSTEQRHRVETNQLTKQNDNVPLRNRSQSSQKEFLPLQSDSSHKIFRSNDGVGAGCRSGDENSSARQNVHILHFGKDDFHGGHASIIPDQQKNLRLKLENFAGELENQRRQSNPPKRTVKEIDEYAKEEPLPPTNHFSFNPLKKFTSISPPSHDYQINDQRRQVSQQNNERSTSPNRKHLKTARTTFDTEQLSTFERQARNAYLQQRKISADSHQEKANNYGQNNQYQRTSQRSASQNSHLRLRSSTASIVGEENLCSKILSDDRSDYEKTKMALKRIDSLHKPHNDVNNNYCSSDEEDSCLSDYEHEIKTCQGRTRCSASRHQLKNQRSFSRAGGKDRSKSRRKQPYGNAITRTVAELKESICRLQKPTVSSYFRTSMTAEEQKKKRMEREKTRSQERREWNQHEQKRIIVDTNNDSSLMMNQTRQIENFAQNNDNTYVLQQRLRSKSPQNLTQIGEKQRLDNMIDTSQRENYENMNQIMPLNQLKAISKAMNDLSAVETQVKDLKSQLERTSQNLMSAIGDQSDQSMVQKREQI